MPEISLKDNLDLNIDVEPGKDSAIAKYFKSALARGYGMFRAAGLAGYLIDHGLAFNGIVLIGTTLNLETIWSRSDDLVYELEEKQANSIHQAPRSLRHSWQRSTTMSGPN